MKIGSDQLMLEERPMIIILNNIIINNYNTTLIAYKYASIYVTDIRLQKKLQILGIRLERYASDMQ